MSNRRKKTFRGGKAITDFEPIEFELNDQTFTCKPALQGAVLLEFGEYTRFRDYLKSPDLIIDMELIGEIAAWLVEQYTDRPTSPSGSSDTGQSSSGHESTEPVSSGV
jgi:hypothetical protein